MKWGVCVRFTASKRRPSRTVADRNAWGRRPGRRCRARRPHQGGLERAGPLGDAHHPIGGGGSPPTPPSSAYCGCPRRRSWDPGEPGGPHRAGVGRAAPGRRPARGYYVYNSRPVISTSARLGLARWLTLHGVDQETPPSTEKAMRAMLCPRGLLARLRAPRAIDATLLFLVQDLQRRPARHDRPRRRHGRYPVLADPRPFSDRWGFRRSLSRKEPPVRCAGN